MRRKLVIDGNAVYEIDDECESLRLEKAVRSQGEDTTKREHASASVNISMGYARKPTKKH